MFEWIGCCYSLHVKIRSVIRSVGSSFQVKLDNRKKQKIIFFVELSNFFGCRSEKLYFEYWEVPVVEQDSMQQELESHFCANFIQEMDNKQFNFTFRSSRSFQLMELKKMWAMISLASSAPPPNRFAGS